MWVKSSERIPTEKEADNLLFLEYPAEQLCGLKHIGWYFASGYVFEDDMTGEQFQLDCVPFWMPIPSTCVLIDNYVAGIV